jgi:hypothetical protein
VREHTDGPEPESSLNCRRTCCQSIRLERDRRPSCAPLRLEAVMFQTALTVDEPSRLVLVYLNTLKLPTVAAITSSQVPQVSTPNALALWVSDMADVIASHVYAIRHALPAQCLSLEAPAVGGER